MRTPLKIIVLILGSFLAPTLVAFAGPPFLTDDPEPTDYQHFETYLFTMGNHDREGYNNYGPGVEINYGGLPDTQFSATFGMTSVGGNGTPSATGLGDSLFGVKYRFVHETNGWPQIAVYPQVYVPTGNSRLGLGNGSPSYELPFWLQKSWGPWTTYGGGGVLFNPEPGHRNYPLGGWLLQRDLGKYLTLGGEFYAQGRDLATDRGFGAVNFGGLCHFNEMFSLVFSAGHSVVGDRQTLWYFGLNFNW